MRRAGWAGFLLLTAGCLGPMPPRGRIRPVELPTPSSGTLPSPLPAEETPPVLPVEVSTETSFGTRGLWPVLWTPPPKSDALAAAKFLAARPDWRVTALFPESYFTEDLNGRQARALFTALVSSGRVEVVLTLPGRPMLPLLMDTDHAKLSTAPAAALPPRFAWPQDVTEQIALARSAHRRKWKADPAVVAMPWDAVLGPELDELAKFKLRVGLLTSTAAPTLWEDDRLTLLRPAPPPSPSARKDWVKKALAPDLTAGAAVGPVQVSALEDLAQWETWIDTATFAWARLSDVPRESYSAAVERRPPPPPDFTPWIGDTEENRAWELLGVARQALEDITASGQADLRGLNLAARAVYAAEGGAYFWAFGEDSESARDGDLKREFLASLQQVFQLLGRPAPPEIRGGFSRNGSVAAVEGDSTFERAGDVLRWRDPKNDDRGPGAYYYPAGAQYETGSWDLRVFDVAPGADSVTLGFEFAALPNPQRAPLGFCFPLTDVYIDINRSPGAGSQELLPGRPGLVEPQDAWEYALTVDGWGARLSQLVPGGAPRTVATPSVVKTSPTRFEVALPLRLLRGDPASWGYGVAVMGRAAGGAPMPVGVEPGPAQFGGGLAGDRPAPPYIDLLTPEGVGQRRVLGVYQSGQDPTLPFVRAE